MGDTRYFEEFLKTPTHEEWYEIYASKREIFENVEFPKPVMKYDLLDFIRNSKIEFDYMVMEFNNRKTDLVNNYVLLMHYYNAGIPDEKWYEQAGGKIHFFPNFEEEHHVYHYWFGFFMESYYHRYSGLIDNLYHLINLSKEYKIKSVSNFRKKVSEKLKGNQVELYGYLESVRRDPRFKRMNDYRNDLTHNFRPHQINSGFGKPKIVDGKKITSFGVGSYTTTREFVSNIHESLDLLSEMTNKIKEQLLT